MWQNPHVKVSTDLSPSDYGWEEKDAITIARVEDSSEGINRTHTHRDIIM